MPVPPWYRGPPKFYPQPQRLILFQKKDGTPLRFYIRPGAAKMEVAPLILRHGGSLCRVQEPGAILLARPGEVPAGASGVYTSTSYVTNSVAQKVRLHLEDYQLDPPPPAAQSKNTAEGRMPFTVVEDSAILGYVRRRKQEGQAGALGGTAFWKEMARARVTPHPWQAMRDRYLKHLRPKECLDLLDKNPKQKKVPEPHPSDMGAASHDEKPAEVSRPQDQSQVAGGSEVSGIFQMANKEFEDSEGDSENLSHEEEIVQEQAEPKTSEEATSADPKIQVAEATNSEDLVVSESLLPAEEQPSGPSAEEVAMAVQEMKRFMEEFGVDVATVTQAFLKNSGDVAAVACCLRSGQRPDGCPLWTRQDDTDLLTGAEDLLSRLSAKYGAENVKARLAFRKS
nr:telomeric repeat-binding factor 2-interacting protein 1 [Pogona vitticeps]